MDRSGSNPEVENFVYIIEILIPIHKRKWKTDGYRDSKSISRMGLMNDMIILFGYQYMSGEGT